MKYVEEVSFTVEDQRLAGTIFRAPLWSSNKHGILFIHGWRSNQISPRQFARRLNTVGKTCLTFDMRGCGDSDGDVLLQTRNDFLADALAAYDYLFPLTEEISVVGSSFGAYLACLLSARRPVSSLVLRVPANYSDHGFDSPQAEISDRFMQPDWHPEPVGGSQATEALRKFDGRTLIIEAADDEMVHSQTVARYVSAGKDVTHVVEPGPHSLVNGEMRSRYQQLLVNWFSTR